MRKFKDYIKTEYYNNHIHLKLFNKGVSRPDMSSLVLPFSLESRPIDICTALEHVASSWEKCFYFAGLSAIPHPDCFRSSNLILQLENSIKQRLSSRGAAWHVYVHRNDSVHASYNTIAVMVVSPAVCARSHTNHPLRIRHLIITLSKSWSHFIRKSSRNYHDIGLARGCSKNNSQAVLIISWHRGMHHLYTAACKTEAEWPHRSIARPRNNLIDRCSLFVNMFWSA